MKNKAKKFTEKQLSIILSHTHELEREGAWRSASQCRVGCINQAAYNELSPVDAANKNVVVADWFDESNCAINPVFLLSNLEKLGAA